MRRERLRAPASPRQQECPKSSPSNSSRPHEEHAKSGMQIDEYLAVVIEHAAHPFGVNGEGNAHVTSHDCLTCNTRGRVTHGLALPSTELAPRAAAGSIWQLHA